MNTSLKHGEATDLSNEANGFPKEWITTDEYLGFAAQAITKYVLDRGAGYTQEIRSLLDKAMSSQNAEFLVELGEQFDKGLALPRDEKLAVECFKRAHKINRHMGGYALGRHYYVSDVDLAKKYLSDATSAGHIPSSNLLMALVIKMHPSRRLLYRLAMFYRAVVSAAIYSFHPEASFYRPRVWRYTDDSKPIELLERKIGQDRKIYFPWTKPMSIKLYLEICQGRYDHKISTTPA